MNTPNASALVDRLFQRFMAAYGAQKVTVMWRDIPGDQAEAIKSVKVLWGRKLAEFHQEVILGALDATIDSGNPWPPTLPEFVKACFDAREARRHKVEGDRARLALPAPSDIASKDSQVVKDAMAEMRKFLGAHVVGGRA